MQEESQSNATMEMTNQNTIQEEKPTITPALEAKKVSSAPQTLNDTSVYELTGDMIDYEGPPEYEDPCASLIEQIEEFTLTDDQSETFSSLVGMNEEISELYT